MKKIHVKIAGAFSHYNTLLPLLLKYRQHFDFSVFDGINRCKWNGGRVNRDIFDTPKQKAGYDALGVGIAFTFSNPEIDLNDPVGNDILERYHESKNSIILSNYKLLEYIRARFPLYECIYSITAHPSVLPDPAPYYANIEKDFDIIVPKLEHNMIIENFTPNVHRYELLNNDDCLYYCPLWKQHFDTIAQQNTKGIMFYDDVPTNHKIEECWLTPKFNPDIGDTKMRDRLGDKFGMSFTADQTKNRIQTGIHRFKISGREFTNDEFISVITSHLNITVNGAS